MSEHDREYEREQEPEPRPDDKLEAGSLVESSRVLRWLDNFWYHYKWPTVIALFVVVVAVVGIVQMVSRPAYDTAFLCAGPYRMNTEERAAFEELLADVCPEDYNRDGDKLINLVSYQIYSEEDYRKEAAAAEAVSEEFYLNTKFNSDELNNLTNFTMTGECSVYLLSPYLFDLLKTGNRLRPVSALYPDGELPVGVTDNGYGIRFAETDLYRYHPAAQVLPDDMILCILAPTVWGGSSDEDRYARSEALFCAMADYRVKE